MSGQLREPGAPELSLAAPGQRRPWVADRTKLTSGSWQLSGQRGVLLGGELEAAAPAASSSRAGTQAPMQLCCLSRDKSRAWTKDSLIAAAFSLPQKSRAFLPHSVSIYTGGECQLLKVTTMSLKLSPFPLFPVGQNCQHGGFTK